MRAYTLAILLIALIAITGCQATPDLQTPETEELIPVVETPVVETPLESIFTNPVDAIDVALVLDTERTVEALIPIEGGTLSATGADGTVYNLEIPADALLNETTISLTPASSISGLPFGSEQTYSVQLSPEGLYLYNFATLTITPAQEIPVDQQIFYGYQADGQNFGLALPVVAASEIKIQVLHFSGYGVTRGLMADIEPVRERLGGDAERQLESAVSEDLQRLRQQGAAGQFEGAVTAELLDQYEEQVVKPRVAAAGESCAAGQLAVQAVLTLERMRQLLGFSQGGNGLENFPDLISTVAMVCLEEEYALCVEEHVIHRMLPLWLGFVRQFALLGLEGDEVLREARDLTVKCLTFRLEFESTASLDIGGAGYDSTMTSEIILRYNPDETKISGEAEYVNTEFEYRTHPACNVTSTPGGGTFYVFELVYVAAPDASAEYDSGPASFGHVSDFILNYIPGSSSEQSIANCPNQPVQTHGPYWIHTFLNLHIDERDEDAFRWTAIGWEMQGGELFAEKEWSLTSAAFTEKGNFKLYHTPGQ